MYTLLYFSWKLTPSMLGKIVADDSLILFLLLFCENKSLHFMRIICFTDDSHEASSLFSVKKKKCHL